MGRVSETLLDAAAPVAKPKKPKKLSQLKRDLLDIVRFAHGRGVVDMTAMEIQCIYEEQPGKLGGARGRVSDGHIAARVSEMARDGWLLHSTPRRCLRGKCRNDVKTVRVPVNG